MTVLAAASMLVTWASWNSTFRCLSSSARSGEAIFPSDRMPVEHWYSSGWNRWCSARSIKVTCTGARPSARAANRPANPPPTITTRRESDVAAMAHPDPSVVAWCSGLDAHGGRATARGHRPDEGIAGIGAGPAGPVQPVEASGSRQRSVTGGQVDHADVGQSVEHQLHPERSQQETEHLLGDQHPARIQLAGDLHREPEHHDVDREDHQEYAEGDREHRDGTGLRRQGDQDDDPRRVEQ